MARNLMRQTDVSLHDHLTFQGGHSMAEQKKGDQERNRPEHREQDDNAPRRQGDQNDQNGGGGRQTPNNPQRQQRS
jgi:hypothetical protein